MRITRNHRQRSLREGHLARGREGGAGQRGRARSRARGQAADHRSGHRPHVILVVGVNGTGKTTTIGKLAEQFRSEGKSVMMAAGDTFRAAAIEQLQSLGRADRFAGHRPACRLGLLRPGLRCAEGGARRPACDVLLIDTAGRLQNKQALMDELEKVIRVIAQDRSDRAARCAAGAGRNHRPECAIAGRGVSREGRRHRPRHDQARRYSSRRDSRGDRGKLWPCPCMPSASVRRSRICSLSMPGEFARAIAHGE